MAPNTNLSGTTNYWLTYGDVTIEAMDRCGIRASSLTQQQLASAYRSLNLALSTWVNRGLNQWARDLQPLPLVVNQASYNIPSDTIQIWDMYLRQTLSNGQNIDRILYPMSETDYAAIPNKQTPGPPTAFWFNRVSPVPQIFIWPVPNVVTSPGITWSIQYYRARQLQDASLSQGQTPDIPYRFFEALCADIAARLAQKFAPTRWMALKADAQAQWDEASDADAEKVNVNIYPALEMYYE